MNVNIPKIASEMSFIKALKSRETKQLKVSDNYKYVTIYQYREHIFYQAHQPRSKGNRSWSKCFFNERDAARAVDLKRIERGQEPVNILKRK